LYNQIEQLKAFSESIEKLKANFGKDNFLKAKCDLIWNELKNFSPKQIRNLCDVVLMESQFSPKLGEFRDKASILREKIRQWEREQERNQAQEFFKSTLPDSEISHICKTVRDRASGKMSDGDFSQFKDILKGLD
jgi:hypothetical protein